MRYQGIASFLSGHAGATAPWARVTLVDSTPPDFGFGVYLNKSRATTALLDGAANDTRYRLDESPAKLYSE